MEPTDLTVYVASSVGIDYFYYLVRIIQGAGYNVKMLYLIGEDEYRNQAKKSGLAKLYLRFKMYIVYPAYLIAEGFRCKQNSIFIVSSNTFYAPYLIHCILSKKNIRVIHMLYDLYPDALEMATGLSSKSWFFQFLGNITKMNQANCDATVYLGSFLKRHAERRWGIAKLSKVIDISTDLSLYSCKFPEHSLDHQLVIHYGGQLGHLHDVNSIIQSIKYLNESDISGMVRFIFYVSGSQSKYLKKELSNYAIEVCSTATSSKWRSDIEEFDIGLVSLSPGGSTICLPSKTYAMMAGGLAILAIAPVWSDLGKIISNMDSGWVINNSAHLTEPSGNDSEYYQANRKIRNSAQISVDFYQTIKNILNNRNELESKRKNAFFGMRRYYAIDNLQRNWHELIDSVNTNSRRHLLK